MKRVEAVIRPDRLPDTSASLEARGLTGFTISDVRGHGDSADSRGEWRGQAYELQVAHKLLVTVYVDDDEVPDAVQAIAAGASTGRVGDGLIAVSDVVGIYKISPEAG